MIGSHYLRLVVGSVAILRIHDTRARSRRHCEDKGSFVRLLYVSDNVPRLSETFVRDEMAFFRSRGHSVHLICRKNLKAAEARLIPGNFYDDLWIMNANNQFQRLIWKISLESLKPFGAAPTYVARAMASHLKALDFMPDALIAHFGPNVLLASYLKHRLREPIPLVGVFHGFDLSLNVKKNGFKDYVLNSGNIDLFVPISSHWNKKLRSFGIASEKIRTIHLGVNVDAAPKSPENRNRAKFTIVSVGRLIEKKGFDTLIDAFASLPEPLLERAELLIVGDGPLREALQHRAAAAKGRNSIRFLGALSHSEVLQHISGGSVFVLASRTSADGDMEGIPVVLMEAMAAGTPVISTDHSGIPELIEDGVSGLLVAEDNSAALAKAVQMVAEDPVGTVVRVRAARRQIEVGFNREIQNGLLEAELFKLVADPQALVAPTRGVVSRAPLS